jgi:hypothetical protein
VQVKKRWPCFLLLALTLANFVIPDPLPFIDEALLAGLTALCFGKHKQLPDA